MKNYRLTKIILICFFCFGCESELEISPEQNISVEQALSNETNIINLLNGTYAEAGEQATFGGRSQIISDLLGNTGQLNLNGSFPWMREIFLKNILVDNYFVQLHWANSYEVINQANLILDNLNLISSSDQLRQSVEGEARFLRALAYFDLIRFYGLQYELGNENSHPGVPLRLTGIIDYEADLVIARSSVEEIYEQIIGDLMLAVNLLPESNNIYADKYAAQGLLARVYLQQGKYIEARDAANDVILFSGHSLSGSFDSAFNNDLDSTEDIFAFQITSQDGDEDALGVSGPNALNEFYASTENGGRGADIPVEQYYLNLFDDPVNDNRYSFFYIDPSNGLTLTSKYTNQFANISLLRLAEMHLIRAESNFRLGTIVGLSPLEDINIIRSRSGASPFSSITLDLILNERQLELGLEGHFIHDLRRNQSNVGDLPYNDNSLVLPIPRSEMDSNSLMEQNPGY